MRNIIFLIVMISMVVGCGNDSNNSVPSVSGNLSLNLTGLEPMTGQHYEGWVIVDGAAVTSGRFNVKTTGEVVLVDVAGNETSTVGTGNIGIFNFVEGDNAPTDFILTIEPNGDTDPGPSAVHLTAGSFVGSTANTTTTATGGIGVAFGTAAGTYILATPTTAAIPGDDNQGVWFLNAGAASLTLPALPAEWAYEGWVVNTATGTPVSTGVFSSATGADSNGAGPTAGPDGAPGFPGEDFITPPTILNGGNHLIVISVEPVPDFDPAPFALKILSHAITSGQAAGTANNHTLGNINNGDSITVNATLL